MGLPPDPFRSADGMLDDLGRGRLLREALREARDRGKLGQALGALDRDDLQTVVFVWLATERLGPRTPPT
jgi:hypothetical protein